MASLISQVGWMGASTDSFESENCEGPKACEKKSALENWRVVACGGEEDGGDGIAGDSLGSGLERRALEWLASDGVALSA
ncbi:hypothetical protein GCM10007100_06640 [Roseibacillus persicicus]|uniref:Uncharacterized protein n=1 Tax=Roseibacillus persicicus TaxID=454148 RepID=A0A918TGG8_9BACT|nr:hypothetical protein GCM10007100_06640 [Roseibacillus persicicus]